MSSAARLRRWPWLYRLVAQTYSTFHPLHLLQLIIGTKAQEKRWASRHLYKGTDWDDMQFPSKNDKWILGYWNTRGRRHRAFLVEIINSQYPFASVLEIGCNCGPNLYLLARKYPDAIIRGIDINAKAVQIGNQFMAQEGILNVQMSVAKADDLSHFADESFDIVFTNSLLMYIGPDKIQRVIKEMMRISNRTLILMERHEFKIRQNPKKSLGIYRYGSWERNYVDLISQFVAKEKIRVTKIPEYVWPDGGRWKEVGAVIEVVK